MGILVAVVGICVAASIGAGLYLQLRPPAAGRLSPAWVRAGLLANVALFGAGLAGAVLLGAGEAMAQPAVAATREISLGQGLALLGIGLPTGLAAIGAGVALGPVGSAALAVIAEKPEMFGRTLVYMGLAEGIAIYGLVMSILLLGKL